MFNYNELEQVAARYDERLTKAQEEHLRRYVSEKRREQVPAKVWSLQALRLAFEGLIASFTYTSLARAS